MNARTIGLLAAAVVVLIAGFMLGRLFAPGTDHATEAATEATAEGERRVLYWYDPMVPDQHFDKPGKSPFMDMMLVPRYADEDGETAATGVKIDPSLRQNLGIRTAVVSRAQLEQELRVPGTLQWDLRAEQRVSARVDGIIERLHVATPYEQVRRGQPLATLLAPEWSAALAEYQALRGAASADARALADAARSRLLALGMSREDLSARLPADGIPRVVLRAPIDGVVAEVDVREGERVMAGEPLFRVNATDRVWMLAEVPQARAGLVQPGAEAEITLPSLPGERYVGVVEALLPDLDPTTRSQRARIVLEDPDRRLAAGMYAEARLATAPGEAVPLVPSEALIVDGDGARVIVARDDDRFEAVAVAVGRRAGGQIEILRGLQGGERVVVSGQFLIDSEASLRGALRRLGADDAEANGSTPSDPHAGHAMPPRDAGAARRATPQHEHAEPAAAADDPHAGHRPPASGVDAHEGHGAPADEPPAQDDGDHQHHHHDHQPGMARTTPRVRPVTGAMPS